MLNKLETELKLRGFSPITFKVYLDQNKAFLNYIKKDPKDMSDDDVKKYMGYLISEKNLKPASVSLALSSIKFFYKDILKMNIFGDIKAPKLEKHLPTVLTKAEVKNLLAAPKTFKHQLILELIYGSGLRVSEAVKMKTNDLDFDEKLGIVKSGKGKKDRNIIISESLITRLKQYLSERGSESEYLFPGNDDGHLSIRMAQKVVKKAARDAGIKKRVFCHALRSSFATHLLESGVDIRVIQELLGHSNLATTERYTKVSTEQIKKVKSPLDF